MIVPQIWQDALIQAVQRQLETAQVFWKDWEIWEEEHKRRMATDPEYARVHEEFEWQWREDMERYGDES